MNDLHYLALSVVLTWFMLMFASLARSRGWTPAGMKRAFGNRDDLPEPSPVAARADRAAKNMVENLVLFGAALVAARGAGVAADRLRLGAQLFFFARVVYFGVYLAGIPYLRTAVWAVGLSGTGLLAASALAR